MPAADAPMPAARLPRGRPAPVRALLIAAALLFLGLFLVLPLLVVFVQALGKGVGAYVAAISDPMAWAAVKLTLYVAAIAVPCNLVFGVAAAWEAASAAHAPTPEQEQENEAVLALIALGYKQVDAHKAVHDLQQKGEAKSAEELVKLVLKKMAAGR